MIHDALFIIHHLLCMGPLVTSTIHNDWWWMIHDTCRIMDNALYYMYHAYWKCLRYNAWCIITYSSCLVRHVTPCILHHTWLSIMHDDGWWWMMNDKWRSSIIIHASFIMYHASCKHHTWRIIDCTSPFIHHGYCFYCMMYDARCMMDHKSCIMNHVWCMMYDAS